MIGSMLNDRHERKRTERPEEWESGNLRSGTPFTYTTLLPRPISSLQLWPSHYLRIQRGWDGQTV